MDGGGSASCLPDNLRFSSGGLIGSVGFDFGFVGYMLCVRTVLYIHVCQGN